MIIFCLSFYFYKMRQTGIPATQAQHLDKRLIKEEVPAVGCK